MARQESPIKLVLFDIDGTLLNASGGGRIAFARTVRDVLGGSGEIGHINFSGATDLRVLHQLIRESGGEPSAEHEARFFDQLPTEMDRALRERPPFLLPGVRALLDVLALDPEFELGLVTGNQEGSARAKLRHAGIDQIFAFGGFGCDHADRVEIARRAVQRGPGPRIGFLFGDTPFDVQAALANGLVPVGVATGSCGPEELWKAGAARVFDSLEELDAILRFLRS